MKRLCSIKNDYNLQGLFILLNMYEYNLRYLHWTVKGIQFDEYHEFLQDYYEHIYDDIDMIAEYLVSKNISIPKYGTIASEEDYEFVDNRNEYSIEEIKTLLEVMFGNILTYIDTLMSEQKLTPGIKSKLDEMYYYYEKQVDFINKRR